MRGVGFASAGRHDQLRALTSEKAAALATYRGDVRELMSPGRVDNVPPPALHLVGDQVLDGAEHAFDADSTLCHVPARDVFLMRHLFDPAGRFACETCAAAAAPSRS